MRTAVSCTAVICNLHSVILFPVHYSYRYDSCERRSRREVLGSVTPWSIFCCSNSETLCIFLGCRTRTSERRSPLKDHLARNRGRVLRPPRAGAGASGTIGAAARVSMKRHEGRPRRPGKFRLPLQMHRSVAAFGDGTKSCYTYTVLPMEVCVD